MAPFGVRVVIIEPGVTKSAIFAKTVDTPNASGAYDDATPARHLEALREAAPELIPMYEALAERTRELARREER